MRNLLLIPPNGLVRSLMDRQPTRAELVSAICQNSHDPTALMEHVTVLYQGRRAHAFIHESGVLRGLPANLKATFLHHNWSRERANGSIYDNLEEYPNLTDDRWLGYKHEPMIHGPMLLYPGPLPMWEPEGAPWNDYARATPPFPTGRATAHA